MGKQAKQPDEPEKPRKRARRLKKGTRITRGRLRALQRFNRVIELYLEGQDQCDIAREIGITQGRVSQIVHEHFENLLNQKLIDKTRMTVEHIADHARLRREASKGWRRSCEDAVEVIEEEGPKGVTRKTKRIGQAGDARFLGEIRKLRERDAKLVGLDAPTRITPELAMTGTPDEPADDFPEPLIVDDDTPQDVIDAILASQMGVLGLPGPAGPNVGGTNGSNGTGTNGNGHAKARRNTGHSKARPQQTAAKVPDDQEAGPVLGPGDVAPGVCRGPRDGEDEDRGVCGLPDGQGERTVDGHFARLERDRGDDVADV